MRQSIFSLKALAFRINAIIGIALAVFLLSTKQNFLDFLITAVIAGFSWHAADSYTAENIFRNMVLVIGKKGGDDDEHPTIGPQTLA